MSQIITFGTLQARAAVRDVGRVLDMSFNEVSEITKLIPNNPANPVTLAKALEIEPKLKEKYDSNELHHGLLDTALELEGLYRNCSTPVSYTHLDVYKRQILHCLHPMVRKLPLVQHRALKIIKLVLFSILA